MAGLALHHAAVVVADLPRSEAFYVGVLGLPVLRRHSDGEGRPRSIWVGLGDGFLAIERASAAAPRRADEAPGHHCLALAIPRGEREARRTMLREAGIAIERESPFSLYFRDPDGALLAFSHYPDEAPPQVQNA